MATLFGKETFEGGSLPASFDSQAASATSSTVIDSTSKVVGTYSARVSSTASGLGQYLLKNLGVNYTELYIQFKIFIPTAFAYGTATTVVLMHLQDNAAATVFEMKLDDYGTQEIILQGGTLPYTDTTLALTKNVVHKVELYYKVNATTGAWKVWVDNDTFASPNAQASSLNTGTVQLRSLAFGGYFTDGALTNSIYLDDVVVADTFIGAGTPVATSRTFITYRPPWAS